MIARSAGGYWISPDCYNQTDMMFTWFNIPKDLPIRSRKMKGLTSVIFQFYSYSILRHSAYKTFKRTSQGELWSGFWQFPLWRFFPALGRLKKVPLIFDMHGGAEELLLKPNLINIGKYPIYMPIEHISLRLSTKVCCVSKKMIQHLHSKKECL